MYQKLKMKKIWTAALIIPLFFSCSEVMLIGAYNQNVDQTIQSISSDVSTLFITIEKNIQDNQDYSYAVFRNSYIKIESEISSCKTIASGIPKYNIIIKQIDLLSGSVALLEQDHRSGFFDTTKQLTLDQKIKAVEVDRSGINSSIESMLALQEGLKREKADK